MSLWDWFEESKIFWGVSRIWAFFSCCRIAFHPPNLVKIAKRPPATYISSHDSYPLNLGVPFVMHHSHPPPTSLVGPPPPPPVQTTAHHLRPPRALPYDGEQWPTVGHSSSHLLGNVFLPFRPFAPFLQFLVVVASSLVVGVPWGIFDVLITLESWHGCLKPYPHLPWTRNLGFGVSLKLGFLIKSFCFLEIDGSNEFVWW